MTKADPLPKGGTGRDLAGRFADGWKGGPGNPFAKRVACFRAALMESITEDDVRDVAKSLLTMAKNGDVIAARELLSRLIGDPKQTFELEGNALPTTVIFTSLRKSDDSTN